MERPDGVLVVLKPPGMTSHDVVAYLRNLLGQPKAGHTGTLDPGVPGVLPVCLGRATRLAEYLMEGDKAYRAEITLGITTDTQDSFGRVLGERPADHVTPDELGRVLGTFTGILSQVPPMYSAVKHRGRPLYHLARQGIQVDRKPRLVHVKSLRLVRFEPGPHPRALLDVVCSRGTYLRTLCADIGEALGCGAHMSYLIRTCSGPFRLEDAWPLEEIRELHAGGMVEKAVLPVEKALVGLPAIQVDAAEAALVLHGRSPLGVTTGDLKPGTVVQLKGPEGTLLAVAEVLRERGLRLRKVFI